MSFKLGGFNEYTNILTFPYEKKKLGTYRQAVPDILENLEILIAGRLTERPSLFGKKKKKKVKESHKSHKRLKLKKKKYRRRTTFVFK